MSRGQVDDALSRYYMLNNTQYYNNNNVGKFCEWCENNGYDTDMIADEIISTNMNSKLLQFDPNFPINQTSADKMKEILNILMKCWTDPYAFMLESIMYQKQDPNLFILQYLMDQQRLAMDGYLRQQIFINTKGGIYAPKDIINLCLSFFELNIKLMYDEIEAKSTKKSSKTNLNQSYFNNLAIEFDNNHTYFLAYKLESMFISQCKKNGILKASMYFKRSQTLRHWNLSTEAKVDIQTAIEYDPQNPDYKFLFAMLLYAEGKYVESMEQLIQSDKIKKGDWKYHCAMGRCCIKLNNLEEAKYHIHKAMKLAPNNYHTCYTYVVFVRDFVKDYKETEIYYQKCLKIDDSKCEINASYGYFLYLIGKYDEARKYLEIALDIGQKNNKRNNNKWIYYYFALLDQKLGHEAQANISLSKAIASIEKPSNMLWRLGKIMESDPENMDLHQRLETAIKEHLK